MYSAYTFCTQWLHFLLASLGILNIYCIAGKTGLGVPFFFTWVTTFQVLFNQLKDRKQKTKVECPLKFNVYLMSYP